MATPAAHPEVESQDEEFLHHLRRGADLLARGELERALGALERARDLRARDPQVLGLLGQALYKLGRFDQASEAYQRLVDESPIEASARVNLGLSHLKARRFAQAVRQLEVAIDLSPDHKRAMGYLGLAWLDQGDPARARAWFERAGSPQMVARCDELLAAVPASAAPASASAAPLSAATTAAAPPVAVSPAVSPAVPPGDAAADGQGEVAPATALLPPTSAGEGATTPPAASPFVAVRALAATPGATFTLDRGLLTVAVRRDVLARAQGMLAVRGAVRLTPAVKRFRGRPTEKAFGEGGRRMLRASGEGALLYGVAGQHLARVALDAESAYWREEAVFAFEDALAFENGRVASRAGPDLHLVHLQGQGELLLATSGEVVAVDVARGVPVRVRLAALLGWTGALTPKVGSLARGFAASTVADAGDPAVVELAGEGRVLLDLGAAAA